MIAITVDVMGASPIEDDPMEIFIADLIHLSNEAIATALTRCRREIRPVKGFPWKITPADVLDRAGVVSIEDAEEIAGLAAWDFVLNTRHLANDRGEILARRMNVPNCEKCGNTRMLLVPYDRSVSYAVQCECLTRIEPWKPEISDRVQGVVDQLGGWITLKAMASKDLPFAKRDFLSMFKNWRKMEELRPQLPAGESMGLSAGALKRLEG